ncbi:fluoride efflux transporter CrcB [uncultured Pseudoteredinibacter sp.]|uniref:fluoride efflux transporter CrcB n=1 Tax=uncultured Pseudoteredinibacter sp. TaxID=1641701 RepID=UPI0026049097|nr:fluoride efflux transporter CrcB [uncultured Pseudoteredinibacter sp.]
MISQWVAVAAGGSLGALCRYAIANYWLIPVAGRLPLATIFVNLLGSALMGFLYVLIVEEQWFNPQWRNVLMAGFLGAFTTFSTFSLEALSLWQNQDHSLAVSYVLLNVLGSLLCVFVGAQLAMKVV